MSWFSAYKWKKNIAIKIVDLIDALNQIIYTSDDGDSTQHFIIIIIVALSSLWCLTCVHHCTISPRFDYSLVFFSPLVETLDIIDKIEMYVTLCHSLKSDFNDADCIQTHYNLYYLLVTYRMRIVSHEFEETKFGWFDSNRGDEQQS